MVKKLAKMKRLWENRLFIFIKSIIMKYRLHPSYQHTQPLITNIEDHFQDFLQILQTGRNEIRVIKFADEEYVVKSFKIPNFINRFAYRYLRPSKAKRSYEYSVKLGAEICPEPVAYIEQYQYQLLSRSYFICRYFNYDFTIRALLNDVTFPDRTQILQEFAVFTYHLHQRGILHHDYSPGNILIKKQQDQQKNHYEFKIIDINRMQFRELNLQDRLGNFVRLMTDDATMKVILDQYAQLIEKPQDELLMAAIKYRDQFIYRRKLKNKLRGR